MKKIAILTVSDNRTLDSDTSGKLAAMKMANAGLSVVDRIIVNDDIVDIQTAYLQLGQQALNIVIANGGAGIAQRGVTIPAIRPLLKRLVPGFGKTFRQISFDGIGTRALASQALAGLNCHDQLTYCLPDSHSAYQTTLSKLVLSEYGHLLFGSSSRRKEVRHHAH